MKNNESMEEYRFNLRCKYDPVESRGSGMVGSSMLVTVVVITNRKQSAVQLVEKKKDAKKTKRVMVKNHATRKRLVQTNLSAKKAVATCLNVQK